MKAVLSENHVKFAFMDIAGSMLALKSFLLMRDTSDAYKEIRGTKSVGIPVLVVDDVPYIVEKADRVKAVIEELHLAE